MNEVPLPEKSYELRPNRPKAWKELTDAEKIERMHDVVKSQTRDLDRMRDEVYKLRNHQHKENGDLLIPYSHSSRGELAESMASPEAGPWF